ncbi:MAG: DNA primase [bacterium]|jgi:DNA primase|nr:DNA primase [bacterium]
MAEINTQLIEDVRSRADIVDIISDYVKLSPAGKNFKGLCPFHSEKTPSFVVSKERQIFNCFGCGEKGNVFGFIQKVKNVSFVDALKLVADRYQMDVDIRPSNQHNQEHDRLFQANEKAMQFYQLSLTNMAAGQEALAYLKQRGLQLDTIQGFQIGYAPDKQDQLYQILREKTSEVDLLELGLIKKYQDGGYFDLFRNRIIFPISNEYGKIVGFSGRVFQESSTEPKYVNSPFTKLFVKGDILYNLFQALNSIRQHNRVFLYEGFMDVIASHKANIKEAVASMGTALTPNQAKLLRKVAEHVILCYDGDKAGFEAMNKAIKILEDQQCRVSVLLLPEGLDPDEYLKKYGEKKLQEILETTQIDPWEFRYQYIKRGSNLKKASEMEQFKQRIFELLLSSGSDTITNYYIRQMAADIQVDVESIKADLRHTMLSKQINQTKQSKKPVISMTQAIPNRGVSAENSLVNYFIKADSYRYLIEKNLPPDFCADKLNREILQAFLDLMENKVSDISNESIVKQFSFVKQPVVMQRLSPFENGYSLEELDDLIFSMKSTLIDRQKEQLIEARSHVVPTDPKYTALSIKIQEASIRKDKLWKNRKSSQN